MSAASLLQIGSKRDHTFLWPKRLNCPEMYREIVVHYSKRSISRPAIYKWCGKLKMAATTSLTIISHRDLQPPSMLKRLRLSSKFSGQLLHRNGGNVEYMGISYGNVHSIHHAQTSSISKVMCEIGGTNFDVRTQRANLVVLFESFETNCSTGKNRKSWLEKFRSLRCFDYKTIFILNSWLKRRQ